MTPDKMGRIGINRPRGWGSIAAALILTVLTMAPAIADARDPVSDEARIVEFINEARVQEGLAPLTIRSDLTDVARGHAGRMAAEDRLYHNPNLRYEVSGYISLAENIAYSTSTEGVHREMMNSTPHRGVILTPAFTEVGVGAVWADKVLWVSHVFREPDGSRARRARRPVAPAAQPVEAAPSRPTVARPSRSAPARSLDVAVPAAPVAPPAVPPPATDVQAAAPELPVPQRIRPVAAVADADLGAVAPAGGGDEALLVTVAGLVLAALTMLIKRLLRRRPFA